MRRKGQAAMEFLMTYGWAILVVLAAIGALTYFGVINPSKWAPDQCAFGPEFGVCSEFKVDATANNVTVGITNSVGSTIDVFNISFISDDCTGAGATTPQAMTASTVDQGRLIQLFSFNCAEDLTDGEPVSGTLDVVYRKQGDTLTHTAEGQFVAKAE